MRNSENIVYCQAKIFLYYFSGIGRQVFGKSLECIGCNKAIRSGNIAVEAPRLGEQVI